MKLFKHKSFNIKVSDCPKIMPKSKFNLSNWLCEHSLQNESTHTAAAFSETSQSA